MNGNALATLFEGREIRVVEHNGEIWMPCRDLSLALGLDRTTLYQHVKRNPDFFSDCSTSGDKMSQTEDDIWINEIGVYLLLARVSVGKVRPEAKEAINKFRKNVPALVQQYRKGEIQQQPLTRPRLQSEDVREAMKVARIISEETGISLPIAQSYALEVVGAEKWQKLLPATTMPSGYLTPSDIANRIGNGMTARRVNLWLYNNHLQIQDSTMSGEWRLTDAGKMHAEEFPFTRNNHSGYQIKWRDSVLQLMNIQTSGQTSLPAAG